MDHQNLFLVCTVGGSPPPIISSIKHWQPVRMLFVCSRLTRGSIEQEVLPPLAASGVPLDAGRYDFCVLDDEQDFAACVRQLHVIVPDIHRWLARGATFRVVVDFTGGTKPMSAALALHAHRWRCDFGYVGGRRRTKDGVGVVESGSEWIVHQYNPWDTLGFQTIEDFVQLFDEGAYASAERLVDAVLRNVRDPARKRELSVLSNLARGYGAWDRFDHRQARKCLEDVLRGSNDLAAVLASREAFEQVRQEIQRHRDLLEQLGPERPEMLVRDLLANARRCAAQQRWDDATARLYRAIEAIAQCRLHAAHGISSTKQVTLDQLPGGLRAEWQDRAQEGCVMLGLQDAYRLLSELGDPLGARFVNLGLERREGSPLSGRNDSILAHGFTSVGERTFDQLWKCALKLAECDGQELWCFPVLSPSEPTAAERL